MLAHSTLQLQDIEVFKTPALQLSLQNPIDLYELLGPEFVFQVYPQLLQLGVVAEEIKVSLVLAGALDLEGASD